MPPNPDNQHATTEPSDPLRQNPASDPLPEPPQSAPIPQPEMIPPQIDEPSSIPPAPSAGSFNEPGQTFLPGSQNPVALPVDQAVQPDRFPASSAPSPPSGQPSITDSFRPDNTAAPPPFSPPKKKKTKLYAGIAAALIVLLLAAGYAFAFYIPNKPQNVFKTGLSRSGRAINELVNQATEQKSLDSIKHSDVTGTVDVNVNGVSYSGNVDVKFDPSKVNGGLTVSSKEKDQTDKKLTVNFLSDLPQGTEFPNVFLQILGMKQLGLDDYAPGLSDYDGKWISIDADYIKSLGYGASTAENNEKKQISAADVSEIAKAATSATTDYVLTSDPQKAVFVQKKFIGKEKVDGINTYHYQVGVDKEHVKAYCSDLITNVYSTNAYKKLPWVDSGKIEDDKTKDIKDCQDSADSEIKDSDTLDMWVEAKYKLIHKVREYDDKLKDTYTDIGQTYTGGDTFTFFSVYHSGEEKSDVKFNLDLNMKSYDTKATLTMSSGAEDFKYDAKVVLEAKPYNKDIDVTKPAGAIPLKDVLNKLGVDPAELGLEGAGTSSSLAETAANTERQTDIKALHGQIEAYYAQNGQYPTLANMNDASWRSTNMKGLDKEALKDPSGTTYTLAASPAAKTYSYAVFASDGTTVCNNTAVDCAVYDLTATLDGGGTYVKSNLN